jgi:hypothetical protein
MLRVVVTGAWDATVQHVFVYASAQPISPQWVATCHALHPNVRILSRDGLQHMYGPMMARAHGFSNWLPQYDAVASNDENHGHPQLQITSAGDRGSSYPPTVAPQ